MKPYTTIRKVEDLVGKTVSQARHMGRGMNDHQAKLDSDLFRRTNSDLEVLNTTDKVKTNADMADLCEEALK